ncbi:50S ribosomal protein L10 [Candidatus Marinimicrobia bacterium]|jgi:large subunit ribosomal protein L10|nr:50S ribosomal protein L10 [Candidatus Neomarinimicrobiota bacterium]
MPTPQKAQIIAETAARFQKSKGVYFTKYTGMDVSQATSLRKQFRENDIEYVVTKNSLTRIAAKEAGLEGKFDDILEGQIGIAYSVTDPTSPARVIKGFVKDNKECLDVVGVFFDGEIFDPSKYVELANLPSREELIAKFASCLNQPMTVLASTLNGAMTKLAGTLDSLKNTKA